MKIAQKRNDARGHYQTALYLGDIEERIKENEMGSKLRVHGGGIATQWRQLCHHAYLLDNCPAHSRYSGKAFKIPLKNGPKH
ncbi:hypothetical protein NECAME_17943 [Necator americanus]|uniref:Uncharacterized protein n=1 Tax=Necator americanus TaxID=51031 RepID=W2TGU7_NECAM|nr:hypothetical protein NECAME_17943 [Necator americanus]ETN81068.1 hypothetical protein NECAME_17943 [Necator americanus]